MMLVDSHAHLTDERLRGETGEVVARARDSGVTTIVTIASDLADSEETARLAREVPGVFASVGVHPHAAESATDESFARLRDLAGGPGVVAIGETGLDFHYDNSPRDAQRDAFIRHLDLAREVGLPVVVHARDADAEVSSIISDAGWERGVLHCFSGGRELLDDALALGWFISFAGMITFPRWALADLLRAVPLDRLLVETDSPYLAPVPHRGRRNEPALVRVVAEKAAEIRGEDPAILFAATSANARTLYGLAST